MSQQRFELAQLPPQNGEEREGLIAGNSIHGTVTIEGATTSYTLEVPETLKRDEIIVWINGFSELKKSMRSIARETTGLGAASLRLSPVRQSGSRAIEHLFDSTRVHALTIDAALQDIAANPELSNTQNGNRLSTTSMNLGAHSYGAHVATRYALQHPGEIDNIVYMNPVGFEDPQPLRFLGRLPVFFRQEVAPHLVEAARNTTARQIGRTIHHLFSAPHQTAGELLACVTGDNRRYIMPMSHERHIGMALLTGSHDSLTPDGPMSEVAAMVDYYEMLDVGHLGPQHQPRLEAEGVQRALRALDEREARPALRLIG